MLIEEEEGKENGVYSLAHPEGHEKQNPSADPREGRLYHDVKNSGDTNSHAATSSNNISVVYLSRSRWPQ
jgi:hypothetical protein